MFCLLFAVFYGFGSIFILTWNASVIGTAMGTFAENELKIFLPVSYQTLLKDFKERLQKEIEIHIS